MVQRQQRRGCVASGELGLGPKDNRYAPLCAPRRAHAGRSFSARNGVDVPVVPITKRLFCRSITHWCRRSIYGRHRATRMRDHAHGGEASRA